MGGRGMKVKFMVLCGCLLLVACASQQEIFEERRAQLTDEEKVAVDACIEEGLEPGNMTFVNCAIRELCLRRGLAADSSEHRQCFDDRKDLYLIRYFSRDLDVRIP